MEKQKIYFLLDSLIFEYKCCYQDQGEENIISDLKKYLPCLANTSQIVIITGQNLDQAKKWLTDNDLNKYVYSISEPLILN